MAIHINEETLIRILAAVAILIATALIIWLLKFFWAKTPLGKNPSSRAFLELIVIVLWVIAIIFAVSQLTLDVSVLLVLLAAACVAVVLATRDIVQNRISHDVLLGMTMFKIGDWIEVDGRFGRVVEVRSQTTTLVSHDNEIYFIPNSLFLRLPVTNRSSHAPKVMVPFKARVKGDIGEFERELLSRVEKSCADALAPDTKPEMFIKSVTERDITGEIRVTISNIGKQKSIVSRINKIISELMA